MSLTFELLLAVTANVLAGIILYYVCKWLDDKDSSIASLKHLLIFHRI
ncbi:Uncharacterised protein [Streptococcus massiliensis]|uniref:Uncharacterized protein n=1 Tax=Streptococcus massiliensis TaxID=313439 RepID=A0A380KZ97_9STRE|nr:Uncharacterised protein [Streptococcus massiliensis]